MMLGGTEGNQKDLLMKSMLVLRFSFVIRSPSMNMEYAEGSDAIHGIALVISSAPTERSPTWNVAPTALSRMLTDCP